MSLPKIEYPITNIKVPSIKKSFPFRPFLVKEEKLLLMAKEENNTAEYLSAIKQVVNNCCLDKNLNINSLAIFDLEYLFLKLRAISVENVIKLSYVDTEDQKEYNFELDLNTIEVTFPDKIDNNIKLSDTTGILMKYPSASLYDDKEFLSLERDYMFELIIKCMDKIYENDSVYETKDYSKQNLMDFLDNLSIKTFEDIQKFLLNVPKLKHEINYKNSFGNDRKIVLESLNDFFPPG